MKNGGSKKENKQLLRQGFPNSFERWRRGLGILLWGILTVQCFCHVRFSNHWLIKISMIYKYIKPKVKKSHTTAMTINKAITAINEACIGWLH